MTCNIINCVVYSVKIVLFSELTWRLFHILHEYFVYRHNYEGNNWDKCKHIIHRVFCINNNTLCCIFITFLLINYMTYVPISNMITLMVLYWLYRYINIDYSDLQHAKWIRRDDHGLDYATGMASNYFFGYLKLTLPSHTQHGSYSGIRERIKLYEDQEGVKFALKRLIILVPSDMYMAGKIESSILSKDGVKPLETIIKNRAGVARLFKNDVYRFMTPINGTFYYVALEGATPLLSFYESMRYEVSEKRRRLMRKMKKEIVLKFYRHLKYLLNEWPDTQNEVELILYNSLKADKGPQDVGEVLLAHLKNMWEKKYN